MKRPVAFYEGGRKYVLIHGFSYRSGYTPPEFNRVPLTVTGPKPQVGLASAILTQLRRRQAKPTQPSPLMSRSKESNP
jgi:hypothetical protein